MKNFQNSLDLSSDLEIVENFDSEPTEDSNLEILLEIDVSSKQHREIISQNCKIYTFYALDVLNPPPEV